MVRIWRSETDRGKFGDDMQSTRYPTNLEPTIEESLLALPLDRVDEVLSAAAELTVPVRIAEPATGVDGTDYSLSFADFDYACAHFMWWRRSWMDSEGTIQLGSPQPGWEGLAAIVESILRLMDGGQPHAVDAPAGRQPAADAGDHRAAGRVRGGFE